MNRTWLKIQSTVHQFVYRISGGKIGSYFGAPTLLLTTLGRKSGLERSTPLYYVEDGQGWAVMASNAGSDNHPAWFLNLQANSSAKIQIRDEKFDVKACVAGSDDKARLWAEFLELFTGYETYQQMTDRDIPIVILQREQF